MEPRKSCFVITPIGDDGSEIRREIDGLIETCIEPILMKFGYSVIVAHRISKTGSITKQIVESIYESELTIANISYLNPNVMYELAFRHSILKPVITLKNKNDGFKIPFDIQDDRTIFYRNDMMGIIELGNLLEKYICEIERGVKVDNPISRAVSDYEITRYYEKNNANDAVSLDTQYLAAKIDRILGETIATRKAFLNCPATDFRSFRAELREIEVIAERCNSDDKEIIQQQLDRLDNLKCRFSENLYGISSVDQEEFNFECQQLEKRLKEF